MTAAKYMKLKASTEWRMIARDVLNGGPASVPAREVMWFEVLFFVERMARLPIGALGDDEDVRREIGLRVMVKLEAASNKLLAEWYGRAQQGKNSAMVVVRGVGSSHDRH